MGKSRTLNKTRAPKSAVYGARLPRDLIEQFEVQRLAAGQSKSDYLRSRLLSTTTDVLVDGQKITQEEIKKRVAILAKSERFKREHDTVQRQKLSTLNRIGNNLNQIARRAHISYKNQELSEDKYVEFLEELLILEKLIRNVL